jgi:hypothetical protein
MDNLIFKLICGDRNAWCENKTGFWQLFDGALAFVD